VRVCFVCSGNICRSPTAEVVFAVLAGQAGFEATTDSAGTGGWHVGQDMDRRSRATLETAGYTPALHGAKQFTAADFAERDVVVALDSGHLRELRSLAGRADEPDEALAKIVLLRDFDPTAEPGSDVADPYYGGQRGFEDVLEQIERASAGLLAHLRAQEQAATPPA
jgi:protein-tyrosine phosphatase